MKKIIAFLIVIHLTVAASFAQEQNSSLCPVNIKFLNQRGGKPPLKFNHITLSITNNNDSLRWYVFPRYLEDSLQPDGNFKAESPWSIGDIVGRKYPDSTTAFQIVDIEFLGAGGFIAFCIPAKSTMTFENYEFESSGDTIYKTIDVWEVGKLLVNGITPFEKWLPFDVKCTKNVSYKSKNGSGSDWSNLSWDRNLHKERSDFPIETVTNIQAMGIKKYVVRFTGDKLQNH